MSARAVNRPPRQRPASDGPGIPWLVAIAGQLRDVSVGRPLSRGPATVRAEDAPAPSIAPPRA
jgi:hypothetical protein